LGVCVFSGALCFIFFLPISAPEALKIGKGKQSNGNPTKFKLLVRGLCIFFLIYC